MTPTTPHLANPFTPPASDPGEDSGERPIWRNVRRWGLPLLTLGTFLSIPLYPAGVAMMFTADIHWQWVSMLGGGICILSGLGGLLCGAMVLWKGTFWQRAVVIAPTLYVAIVQARPAWRLFWNVLAS